MDIKRRALSLLLLLLLLRLLRLRLLLLLLLLSLLLLLLLISSGKGIRLSGSIGICEERAGGIDGIRIKGIRSWHVLLLALSLASSGSSAC